MTNEIISCPFCGGKYIGLRIIVNSQEDVTIAMREGKDCILTVSLKAQSKSSRS